MADLVDRIATGKATLLGVDDICVRLGISRSTFDRWVRNGVGNGSSGNTLATESVISFPPPDIRIGKSLKWEFETFKTWLRANVAAR